MHQQHPNDLDETLTRLGWLDLLFFIPSLFIYAVLPSETIWQIILSIFIVIFFSIGVAATCHWLLERFKRKKNK